MPFRHFPKHRFTAMPWKNGGGVTHEVARFPAEAADWDWRISIAEVAQDGPFSPFPGCERALLLLSGAGMRLRIAGREVDLHKPGDSVRFAGEDAVEAFLSDGPTVDFNAIWRRDAVDIMLERRAMVGRLWCIPEPDVSWFVYFLSGRGRVECGPEHATAEAGDALWLSAGRDGPRLLLEAHGEALWLKVGAVQRSSRV